MNYQDRIVIYIDILGFKDLLKNTISKEGMDNEIEINKIIKAYNIIRTIWDLDQKDSNNEQSELFPEKQITIFSDCIVVSLPASNEIEIFHCLSQIRWMIINLIFSNILCRGAISYGKLIHTEKYIFGPALVEAYILESKCANYPRIILEDNIVALAATAESRLHSPQEAIKYVTEFLEKDSDGLFYIDYFSKAFEEVDNPEVNIPNYITKLHNRIKTGIDTSKNVEKANIRIKYLWMKEKFNNMVEECKNEDLLNSLKSAGELVIHDFYRKLDKID